MELNDQTIKNLTLKTGDHIHFIGIGGSSMSGLAELSFKRGYVVTGSDNSENNSVIKLRSFGIGITPHKADNITKEVALVVYTVAVDKSNVELVKAAELGIPVVERGIFLGFIANHFGTRIAVSGVHGKTTTTSMIAAILKASGKEPNVHLGGIIPWAGSNVLSGSGDLFLTEACEYHNNFLHVDAQIKILLNLEPEHLDFFGTYDNMRASFEKFAETTPESGTFIVCADNDDALLCAKKTCANVITYSLKDINPPKSVKAVHHYFGKIVSSACNGIGEGFLFDCYCDGKKLSTIKLHIPGQHNILNALAAIAAAESVGCSAEETQKGFDMFHGTKRRFEIVGKINGAHIVSDYAHHPSEVEATIAAARTQTDKNVIAIFQPHTFSRVISLRDRFPGAFKQADKIIITDVYAAREIDTHEMSGQILSDDLVKYGLNSEYIGPFEEIAAYVKANAKQDDVVLLLGAGTIDKLGDLLK